MAGSSGRACHDERRKKFYRDNDSVCSGPSSIIRDWRSGAKPLCSGCDRNLKSKTQGQSCGRWCRNSCGNVKIQTAESGKWNCDRCRSERLRVLEEKLRDAQIQIEELRKKNY